MSGAEHFFNTISKVAFGSLLGTILVDLGWILGICLHDCSWTLDAFLQQNVQIQIVLCDPIQPPALLLSAFFLLYAAILFASCLSHSICHFPNQQKMSRTCREFRKSANGERIQKRRHQTQACFFRGNRPIFYDFDSFSIRHRFGT